MRQLRFGRVGQKARFPRLGADDDIGQNGWPAKYGWTGETVEIVLPGEPEMLGPENA